MRTELFLAARPLLIDIETDSLRADFGLVLCAVTRPYGPRVSDRKGTRIFRIDIKAPDLELAEKAMLQELRKSLIGVTGVIHYFGVHFDIPFLQTRLGMQGLQLLPKLLQLDMWNTNKRVYDRTITSRRMAAVQALFKEGDRLAPMKSGVEPHNWRRAKFARDQKAMDEIVAHCVKDLDVLEYQVRRLTPLLPDRVIRR